MNNKKLEYLYASIEDDITMAIRQQIPIYTNFFNLAEQRQIERILKNVDDVRYLKIGGYEEAERCIFNIYSIFIDYDIFSYTPIKVLKISWNGTYNRVGHRDVLGAILGLGIKREIVGDIIIEEDIAYVFILEDMVNFVVQNLAKVGAASVAVDFLDIGEIDIEAPKLKSINAIVPSLRLDCITSAGFGMSRTKGVSLIKAGRVMLNWEPCTKPAQEIEPGDIITIRGKGRIKYKDIIRMTKKDKLSVEIERYV